jgi:hypothetical protein
MPRAIAALLALAGVTALVGCGGGEVSYTEVKAAPPALAIPADTGGAVATRTPGASTSATPTPTAAAGTSSSGSTTTTAPSTSGTGTTTGQATGGAAPTATSTPQNTGGASPDQGLDQFCKDNPGACTGTNGN